MDKQIAWFCYHITTEGLVTADQCRELAKAFADAGQEPDLEAFAQAVFDNGLCTDNQRLEKIGTLAMEEAEALSNPPADILGSPGASRPKLALKKAVSRHDAPPAAVPPQLQHRNEVEPPASVRPSAPAEAASHVDHDFVPPGNGFLVWGWLLLVVWVALLFTIGEPAGLIVPITWVMVFFDSRRLRFWKMYKEAKKWDVEIPLGWFATQLAYTPTLACFLLWIPFFPIYLARRNRIAEALRDSVLAGRERGVKRKPLSAGAALWSTTWSVIKAFAAVVLVVVVIGLIAAAMEKRSSLSSHESPSETCALNLLHIDSAKAQWAEATGKDSGNVDPAGVDRYVEGGLKSLKCPGGGTYSVNALGVRPSCSVPEHTQAYVALDQQIDCMLNLGQIDKAKAKWATVSGKGIGAQATRAELLPFIEFSEEGMKCLSGGKYTANPVGTLAQCSVDAHNQAYREKASRESRDSTVTQPGQVADESAKLARLQELVREQAKDFRYELGRHGKTFFEEEDCRFLLMATPIVLGDDKGEDFLDDVKRYEMVTEGKLSLFLFHGSYVRDSDVGLAYPMFTDMGMPIDFLERAFLVYRKMVEIGYKPKKSD